jgi:hypothetical protein
VLGDAWIADCSMSAPTEAFFRVVHVRVVVAPVLASRILNVAVAGIVRHADAVVTSPKSTDQ